MRLVYAVFGGAVFWLVAGGAWAQSSTGVDICPDVPAPVIAASTREEQMILRHDLSMTELTRRGQERHQIQLDRSTARIGGLTDSNIRLRSTIRFLFQQRTDRPEGCLAIGGVDIDVSLVPTVFIVREKKPGTCAYRETLAHEQKHIAVDRGVIRAFMPKFEQAVRTELASQPPVMVIATHQRNARQQAWQAKIEAAMNDVFRDMQQVRRTRQEAVDTPEEYLRVANACR